MSVVDAIRRKYKSFLPKAREVLDEDTGEVISSLDSSGSEVLDPTPIAPPVGFTPQPSMVDYVRDLIRSERLKQEMEDAGMETFEESEDFDVDDDYDPGTPYENDFDPDIRELQEAVEADKKAKSQEPKKKSVAAVEAASFIHPAQPDGSAEPDDL